MRKVPTSYLRYVWRPSEGPLHGSMAQWLTLRPGILRLKTTRLLDHSFNYLVVCFSRIS